MAAARHPLHSTSAGCCPFTNNEEFLQVNGKESVWKPPWLSTLEQSSASQIMINLGPAQGDGTRDTGGHGPLRHCIPIYTSWYQGHLTEVLQGLHRCNQAMEWLPMDIFFLALQRCIENRDLVSAREIYSLLVSRGYEAHSFFVCHLIRTFSLVDNIYEAEKIFMKASIPTAFAWSAIISAKVNNGQAHEACELFKQMQSSGIKPDGHVFFAALKTCIALSTLEEGQLIHGHIIDHGLVSDLFAGSCLVDLYVKCASLKDATIHFQVLPRRSITAWNALMAGYADSGHDETVIQLFNNLLESDGSDWPMEHVTGDVVRPNDISYLHALKACSSLVNLERGQSIHANIVTKGLDSELSIGNTLVDMYSKCGSMRDAVAVFDAIPCRDVVSWSVLMSRHTQQGSCSETLELFKQMQEDGIQPDNITYVCVLKACSMQTDIALGRHLHKQVLTRGIEADPFVGSTLIDMYSKCESCDDARNVFDHFHECSIVTWNAMISGYAQHGEAHETLKLFDLMQQKGIGGDEFTYVSALKSCASLSALQKGINIHVQVVAAGFEADLFIKTTLIDLYSQCGMLEVACTTFNRISNHDVVSWNALIAACAQHTEYQLALRCFKHMQDTSLLPSHATFICILSACSHAGHVKEGCAHFKSMRDDFWILPTSEHYDSMIDLFGHSGCLEEAEDLMETLPFVPNLTEWTSLLSSCRTHGNPGIARRCFDHFVTLDHSNAAGYVLMFSIYAQKGMQTDAEEVEMLRTYANAWKKPAKAYIELGMHIHEFLVGDEMHPRIKDIRSKLEELSVQMNEEGYNALADAADEDKAKSLCGHCEKLAIAFGLLSTPSGMTLRITKNLRVCADCHHASKVISKIEKREIIITDAYRCHRFNDGDCSCQDNY